MEYKYETLKVEIEDGVGVMSFNRPDKYNAMNNLWYLTRLVGPNRAKDLCFTARVIDAQEMYRLGIAQEVFPAEELMPKTMEYAKKLAQGPALAYMTLKNLIDRNWSLSLEQYFDMEAYSIPMLLNSEDFKEGTKAFLEKRKPVFKGR